MTTVISDLSEPFAENYTITDASGVTRIRISCLQAYVWRELPKACCKNVGVDVFRSCGAQAAHWYQHEGNICSYCREHNYGCGTPISPFSEEVCYRTARLMVIQAARAAVGLPPVDLS